MSNHQVLSCCEEAPRRCSVSIAPQCPTIYLQLLVAIHGALVAKLKLVSYEENVYTANLLSNGSFTHRHQETCIGREGIENKIMHPSVVPCEGAVLRYTVLPSTWVFSMPNRYWYGAWLLLFKRKEHHAVVPAIAASVRSLDQTVAFMFAAAFTEEGRNGLVNFLFNFLNASTTCFFLPVHCNLAVWLVRGSCGMSS